MPEGTAGMRGARYKRHGRLGRMSDNRRAWGRVNNMDVITFYGLDDRDEPPEGYDPACPPVVLVFRRTPVKDYTINLSGMTVQELQIFRQAVNYAIDAAEPICERLDEKARQAYANGDDAFERLYRAVAEFFERAGVQPAHDPGLPGGSEDAAPPRGGYPAEPVGLGDGPVPDGSAPAPGPQDDPATDHVVQDVREGVRDDSTQGVPTTEG